MKNTLLGPNQSSDNCSGNGDYNCSSCNNVMNRIYIKNHSCHPFSPEIKGLGWVCLKCGIVELDFKWFNPESISKVINEDAERENKYNSELEFWLKELERAEEQNDCFNYDQAKKQIKKFLEV